MCSSSPGDPVFEWNSFWYFWDETWTQFLGPFPSESDARTGIESYERYISYGETDSFLVGTVWHDGEELEGV